MADKPSEKRSTDTGLKTNTRSVELISFEKHQIFISVFIILILIAVAYGNSLRNGFVWDDETFIVNNPYVHDISRWKEYFTRAESISSVPTMQKMYRPLQTLSFAIDSLLWGNWAGGFHFTSLLLHVVSCIAIIFSFRKLISTKLAAISAIIFSVHPALSEGVLSLASRGNQLYTLFGLLSIGFFLKTEKAFDRNHIFSTLTLTLSLFSKEPAIAILAIMPLIQLASGYPWKIRSWESMLLYAPFIATAVIFLIMRSAVVDTAPAIDHWGGSLLSTLQMQAKVFAIYLYLLIWPFNLKGRYQIHPPSPFPDLLVAGAVILNISLIITAIISYRRGSTGRFISLSIAWFYISLAPVSNLIPIPGSMMGERFLYFTFAGVIPFLARAFEGARLIRFGIAAPVIGIIALTSYITMDILRTPVWRNNAEYFKVLSKQMPDEPASQIRMAQEELTSNNVSSALRRLERLIKTVDSIPSPEDRAIMHYWYGRALLESNRPKDAYAEFTAVVNIKTIFNLRPEFSKDVIILLAESAARSDNLKVARLLLEQELSASPMNDAAWNGLGNILFMMGDMQGAVSAYKRAVEINPGNNEAAINLQNALRKEAFSGIR